MSDCWVGRGNHSRLVQKRMHAGADPVRSVRYEVRTSARSYPSFQAGALAGDGHRKHHDETVPVILCLIILLIISTHSSIMLLLLKYVIADMLLMI